MDMHVRLEWKTVSKKCQSLPVFDTLRDELRKAQISPEKITIKINCLIAMPDYPEKLVKMVEKAVALS
jgi:hypothetical protein